MPHKDPDKRRAYAREYYARTQPKRVERIKLYQQKRLLEIQNIKEASPCTDCGQHYPYYVMDFDHRENKSFGLARAIMYTGWQKILKEIKKCDLVCANCHRKRTHKRIIPAQ